MKIFNVFRCSFLKQRRCISISINIKYLNNGIVIARKMTSDIHSQSLREEGIKALSP